MEKNAAVQHSSSIRLSYALVVIGWLVFVLDRLSKEFVSKRLPLVDSLIYNYPYGGIGVFENWGGLELSINHATNIGAAWGMFSNYPHALIIFRIILIVILSIYLLYFNTVPIYRIPLTMVIAGAIGNVVDFFLYGHVIDMFHFIIWGYDFPVFNIADSAISIGICSLFCLSWFQGKK